MKSSRSLSASEDGSTGPAATSFSSVWASAAAPAADERQVESFCDANGSNCDQCLVVAKKPRRRRYRYCRGTAGGVSRTLTLEREAEKEDAHTRRRATEQ